MEQTGFRYEKDNMADISTKEIRGINFKMIATVIVSTATVVSAYFIKTGQINDKIETVDNKVEVMDQKLSNVLFRDSLRIELMGIQIRQLQNDIIENRRLLMEK